MSNTPFFTIGIPVYNMAKWVGECLDSILSQDFDDFEIICVDDGSKDNSLEVLNLYAEKDNRIKIISQPNGGVSSARNRVFDIAEGKYVFLIDSDDTMCPNTLQSIHNTAVTDAFPDVIQTSHYKYENGVITPFPRFYPGDEYFNPMYTKDERAIRLWVGRTYKPFPPLRTVKTEFIHKYGIKFNTNYSYLEDSAFCFDVYRNADTISYCPVFSYVYQCSREPAINRHSMHKIMLGSITRWEDFYNDIKSWTISDECRHLVDNERISYLKEFRHNLLTIFETARDKDDAFKSIIDTNKLIGKDIKKLPLPRGQSGLICLMFRIIGIPATMSLLYKYLHMRGIAEI